MEKHYIPYIKLHQDSLKQDSTRKEYSEQKVYMSLAMAIKQTRKKLGGWYIGFIVREIIFDEDGKLISDEVVHEEEGK